MYEYKIIFSLVMSVLMVSMAYCQEKPENHPIKTIKGTVMSTDFVGNTISIQTDGQQQMAFVVPDKAVITQQTRNIGLMDIGRSDSVTIQYYVLPPSKSTIVSIVDNDAVVNE